MKQRTKIENETHNETNENQQVENDNETREQKTKLEHN